MAPEQNIGGHRSKSPVPNKQQLAISASTTMSLEGQGYVRPLRAAVASVASCNFALSTVNMMHPSQIQHKQWHNKGCLFGHALASMSLSMHEKKQNATALPTSVPDDMQTFYHTKRCVVLVFADTGRPRTLRTCPLACLLWKPHLDTSDHMATAAALLCLCNVDTQSCCPAQWAVPHTRWTLTYPPSHPS